MRHPLREGFDLIVDRNADAPIEIQDLAEAYWSIDQIDEGFAVDWTIKTSELDYKKWASSAHVVAALGAVAYISNRECWRCKGRLTLTSRQGLADAMRGSYASCRSCAGNLDQQADRILDPSTAAAREVRAAKQAARAEQQRLALAEENARKTERESLRQRRVAAIAAAYAIDTATDATPPLAKAALFAKIGALATLHEAPSSGGLILDFHYGTESFAADPDLGRELFLAALRERFFEVHPSSSPDAFEWSADSGDTLTGSFYPDRAFMYVPGVGRFEDRLRLTAEALRGHLAVEKLNDEERSELQALAGRVVAAEAIRYFRFFLIQHDLADPLDLHRERLWTAARKGAMHHALGHLYRMAWSSTRDGASAYKRHCGMTRDRATTHAVSKFEQWIQRALDQPEVLNEPFREQHDLPLAEVSKIVFRTILALEPMNASPAEVADRLSLANRREDQDSCLLELPSRDVILEWLETDSTWSPADFGEALGHSAARRRSPCSAECAQHRAGYVAGRASELLDRFKTQLSERDAAIAVAKSLGLANASQSTGLSGDVLLHEVASAIGWQASRPSA